jgi:tRNA(Met) C34 N-acetyltransferase TmcA
MNLAKWLDSLAAVLQHKFSPLEAKEYLDEIKTWKLSDDEWISLKALARRRLRFFPRPAELEELIAEMRREAKQAQTNLELFTHTDGRVYAKRPERREHEH